MSRWCSAAVRYAGVAQLVEQLIRNQQIAGPSPATSSNKKTATLFSRLRSFLLLVIMLYNCNELWLGTERCLYPQ